MRYALKSTLTVLTALMITALVAPAAVSAVELPQASITTTETTPIPALTAASTAAAIEESKALNTLVWHDERIAAARERLDAAESSRAQDALEALITTLLDERSALVLAAADARVAADETQDALARAQAAEVARARVEAIATYGMFPVVGPNEYIDSWGFPRSGGRRHKGTDIMAAAGTPVVAVRDGVVTSGSSSLGGITLWLEADDGTRYYYAHLQSVEIGSGQVTTGQVIGYVGSTGNASASAPHLHFEIHRPEAVNPYPELELMAR